MGIRISDTLTASQRSRRDSGRPEPRNGTQIQKCNAGVVLDKSEVDRLIQEGETIQPMQWVETDNSAHKGRDNKSVIPALKSRLVGCGNFEETMLETIS